MADGYVRQEAANITPGNTAQASQINNELNAIRDAFSATTGHTHDGTVGGGAPITTAGLANDAVTYAKIQNVSATDKILGRVSSGAGDIEEITFTDQAQQLADDTSFAAMLVTLGLTATAAEINVLDGVTASTAELNILDGVTATTAELNYTSGVTSNIQTQLNAKQASDAELSAIAALTSAADRLPYFTGLGTAALATFTSAGRTLVAAADDAAQRTALGLGTMATQAASAVSITGGTADSIDITDSTVRTYEDFIVYKDTVSNTSSSRFVLKAKGAFSLNAITPSLTAGTCTIAILKNGVAVTGLSAVNVTTSQTETAITPVSFAAGDVMRIDITSASSAADLVVNLDVTRNL